MLADPPPTTILLVDSFDKDRTYYTDRLKNSLPDCAILEAKDGQTALDLYHSRRVDCIVTELQLPVCRVLSCW
jgi:CheY-like chemotaxis protein